MEALLLRPEEARELWCKPGGHLNSLNFGLLQVLTTHQATHTNPKDNRGPHSTAPTSQGTPLPPTTLQRVYSLITWKEITLSPRPALLTASHLYSADTLAAWMTRVLTVCGQTSFKPWTMQAEHAHTHTHTPSPDPSVPTAAAFAFQTARRPPSEVSSSNEAVVHRMQTCFGNPQGFTLMCVMHTFQFPRVQNQNYLSMGVYTGWHCGFCFSSINCG